MTDKKIERMPMTLRKLIERHRARDGNDDFMDLPIQFHVVDGHANVADDEMHAGDWPTTFRPDPGYRGALRFDVYLHGRRLVKSRQA